MKRFQSFIKQNYAPNVNSMHETRQQFVQNQKLNIQHMKRVQKTALAAELKRSRVLGAMVNVVTEVMPKTLKTTMLKIKIHMQTLIGNVFGIRFHSLEANIDRLHNLQNPDAPKQPKHKRPEFVQTQSKTVSGAPADSENNFRSRKFEEIVGKVKSIKGETNSGPSFLARKQQSLTSGLERMNGQFARGVSTVKKFVSNAIDRAVTTIRSLFGGAKDRLAPGYKKTKAFLGNAKAKIMSITTVEGLQSGLAQLRQSVSDTIANLKDKGISSALVELK